MNAPFETRKRRLTQQDTADYVPRRRMEGQRPVDCYSSFIRHIKNMPFSRGPHEYHVPPHTYYCNALEPARSTPFNPSTALCTQWAHTIFHPDPLRRGSRKYFSRLVWSPTGRKLLAATSTGEFILCNGHAFGTEMKTIAHEDNGAIRALAWGRMNNIIVSGGEGGIVKVWLSSFVQTSEFDTSQRAVRDVSFSYGERKLCTAGQDGSARIWDTERAAAAADNAVSVDVKLEGHGGDVHCCDWHPYKALIVTGSQDREARLWDPRQGSSPHVATIQSHTEPLTCVRWSPCGLFFLTASRDCTTRLWDLRCVRSEMAVYQGHTAEVTSVAWHPTHPNLFVSCGADGLVAFWIVACGDGQQRSDGVCEVRRAAALLQSAHDGEPVTDVKWSPIGHLLATGASDVRLWTRNKPGAMEEIRGTDVNPDALLQQLPNNANASGFAPPLNQ